ncbi:hypothetical protein O181_067163 [Austropuccinia psidii MF-1]|uniref:Uncharacterized protein n=1 Tax=Austropuccinia psidii MF-1 TaxID=1389203 RepID=A0A9Q3ESU3_9BASI|nr:hypothetical protein [Austropuccinia psidii MF-1]
MKAHLKNSLTHSFAINQQFSDHLTVSTQKNEQMIANELSFHNLSVSPHYLLTVRTQLHNNIDFPDEILLKHNSQECRKQRRILVYMNQRKGQLGIYNPNFSVCTLDKKEDNNASWLKLPLQKLLARPFILINNHNNPYLSIIIYQVLTFSSPTLVFHTRQKVIITLNELSTNCQNITKNTDILYAIRKGIGFCQVLNSGKLAGVYSRKAELTKQKIDDYNNKWSKLQDFD